MQAEGTLCKTLNLMLSNTLQISLFVSLELRQSLLVSLSFGRFREVNVRNIASSCALCAPCPQKSQWKKSTDVRLTITNSSFFKSTYCKTQQISYSVHFSTFFCLSVVLQKVMHLNFKNLNNCFVLSYVASSVVYADGNYQSMIQSKANTNPSCDVGQNSI